MNTIYFCDECLYVLNIDETFCPDHPTVPISSIAIAPIEWTMDSNNETNCDVEIS